MPSTTYISLFELQAQEVVARIDDLAVLAPLGFVRRAHRDSAWIFVDDCGAVLFAWRRPEGRCGDGANGDGEQLHHLEEMHGRYESWWWGDAMKIVMV